ncbi:MAG: DNA repair protein RecN [Spirochaetia bacterium]|nr:DNA repair protein RecN [Spirochaetia bacterium]
MLSDIYIKDFALIKEVRISLGSTLNIITGETGAGKSIILGALGLVLGSKATTDLIRSGSTRSFVEASFIIGTSEKYQTIRDFLENNGLSSDEDYLLLKREITTEGKGRSFINARQVPVTLLKEIGSYLVDIHGQNEHQNILKISAHQSILDRYAQNNNKVELLNDLYYQRQKLKQKLISVSLSEEEKNRRLEILSHEIKEIEEASLEDENEIDELILREKSLSHAESILRDISQVYSDLNGSENNLLLRMTNSEKTLEKNSQYDNDISDLLTSFREAFYLLEDVAGTLRQKKDSIMVDPEQLSIVRERLDLLHNLQRKYGKSISEIKQYLEKAKREHEGIELSSEEAAKTKKDIEDIEKKMIEIAEELSVRRREAAASLEEKVKKELNDLGMENTRLRISIKWEYGENGIYIHEKNPEKKYIIHPSGLDIVEILIAASENDTLKPLRKIASGGEMSRIMLALKKVIIDTDPVFSMVFDEVDAGVGGRIAESVGKKLEQVSANSQVIVITHLHQIAGLTTTDIAHFKVSKDVEAGTKIMRLNHEQRIQEIARMVGGQEITDSAIQHAKTILNSAS